MTDVNSKELPSYTKLRHLGHREVPNVLDGPVIVQEKIDGSQISFGVIDDELLVRSKRSHRDLDEQGMFKAAIAEIKKRRSELVPGFVYRGEYLRAPKHNLLKYDRVPKGHIVLFDVQDCQRRHMPDKEIIGWARDLDLSACPVLFEGVVETKNQIDALLDRKSFLGGCKIEGVVIKNYANGQFAKVVSERFQEKMSKGRSSKKPKPAAAHEIAAQYCTEARWEKAIQHLREEGKITDTPSDIGPIIKEIQADVMEEYGDEIKEALFRAHRKTIFNGLIKGFPQWYQNRCSVDVFGEGE